MMIVTIDRVKTELGILDNSTDASISETIPKAEARYRTIAGFNFSSRFTTKYTSGESTFELSTSPDSLSNDLKYGDLIDGDGVPAETYITDIDTIDGVVTVSNSFTADGTELILCQNIEYWPVISAIIMYLIGKVTTDPNVKEVLSKSVGPLSYTFDNSSINKRYGLPESLIEAIPRYGALF